MQEDFDAAAEEAKTLSPEPSDDDKLVLYGLFKQATVGDVNTSACSLLCCTLPPSQHSSSSDREHMSSFDKERFPL